MSPMIFALRTDDHQLTKFVMDHIPRVGEKIVYPDATKTYIVKEVEYWVSDASCNMVHDDIRQLDHIQITLKRIK